MTSPFHCVDPYAKDAAIDWDETYDMLRGPNGFECLLTEPEDRNWLRDGKTVVNKLNEQHAILGSLLGYIITCRRKNTSEWMDGLVAIVNKAAAVLGKDDRVTTHFDGLKVITPQKETQ